MHALIVVAHPDQNSLTHAVAQSISQGMSDSRGGNTSEIADLTAEAFTPAFSMADVAAHHRKAPRPQDFIAEQERIDRADALVLVFPVYWWSMPGILKGWIDRVFSNGWAYDDSEGKVVKKLGRLDIHLVGIGGADLGTYGRHGYDVAMKTQIDHGIFDYCGAPVVTSELLLEADTIDVAPHLETARTIGCDLFKSRRSSSIKVA